MSMAREELPMADEQTGVAGVRFPLLVRRKRPLVLRKAAQSWEASAAMFFQNPRAHSLKTTWRLHPHGVTTVWEGDCVFVEATVGQFLDWETLEQGSLEEQGNPFSSFDRTRQPSYAVIDCDLDLFNTVASTRTSIRKTFWAYADYKHVKELPGAWTELLEPLVNWSALGCPKDVSDSTLWIGTSGAHTPLHHDAYGVNLVAQLRGKKRWLLFPPEDATKLYPTRVPYEESSIFSRVDARAPDYDRFPRFSDTHPVELTLDAGDVLFVPKHWWHFVEAMDTSLSMNVWMDDPGDPRDRAQEALARVLVTSLANGLHAEVGDGWLNPTENSVWPLEETLQVAQLAFRELDVTASHLSETGSKEDRKVSTGDAQQSAHNRFSVRAMVDAITSPKVLEMMMEQLLQGKGVEDTMDRNPR